MKTKVETPVGTTIRTTRWKATYIPNKVNRTRQLNETVTTLFPPTETTALITILPTKQAIMVPTVVKLSMSREIGKCGTERLACENLKQLGFCERLPHLESNNSKITSQTIKTYCAEECGDCPLPDKIKTSTKN